MDLIACLRRRRRRRAPTNLHTHTHTRCYVYTRFWLFRQNHRSRTKRNVPPLKPTSSSIDFMPHRVYCLQTTSSKFQFQNFVTFYIQSLSSRARLDLPGAEILSLFCRWLCALMVQFWAVFCGAASYSKRTRMNGTSVIKGFLIAYMVLLLSQLLVGVRREF